MSAGWGVTVNRERDVLAGGAESLRNDPARNPLVEPDAGVGMP